MDSTKKEKLIEEMFEKGVLVSEDLTESRVDEPFLTKIDVEEDLLVLNTDYINIIHQQTNLVDWYELDRFRVEVEKERDDELYQNELQTLRKTTQVLTIQKTTSKEEFSGLETELDEEQIRSDFTTLAKEEPPLPLSTSHLPPLETDFSAKYPVEIMVSYDNKPKKYTINDFANIFVSRYRFLEGILRNRQELQGTLAISRILGKKEKETVSIIGVVEEVGFTKTGHIILTLEDPTGRIKVLISKNNKDLLLLAKEIVPDEVIGVVGKCGDKIIFSDNVVWPDIPETHELKKGTEEEYAIFLSDLHVGSKVFLKKEFNKFLSWIKGETGNEIQRNLAKKTKYILIAGDLVDGIGVYPSQEEELEITDIAEQYAEFCRLIKQIPQDKQIIICPGNHDMIHLAEPQPIFYKEYSEELHTLQNVILVTNPAIVNIGKTKDFSGFDVLLYHGFSFDYYVSNVEPIRNSGGYHRADLLMKFLLKRRHLAPSFKSTPYFPGHNEDPLLIKKIPDFFMTGHIHYSKVANYKGVTMICGSCWQAKTAFQEKLGHEPEPGRVPVVNLQTRDVKILKFV